MEWINSLAAGGASAARVILSTQGRSPIVTAGSFWRRLSSKRKGNRHGTVDNIDNAWCAKFMDGRKSRSERDAPYVEFDVESLAKYV